MRFLANYFEFLSAGVLSDDFDEALMKSTNRKIMISAIQKFYFFMEDARTRPGGARNYEIYWNFYEIYGRWYDPAKDGQLPPSS